MPSQFIACIVDGGERRGGGGGGGRGGGEKGAVVITHLLHDNGYGDSLSLRTFGQIQLLPQQEGLQVIWEVLLLHEVPECVISLVLPHQPQGLRPLALCVLLRLKGCEELCKAAGSRPHQPLIHPNFCLTELLGLHISNKQQSSQSGVAG